MTNSALPTTSNQVLIAVVDGAEPSLVLSVPAQPITVEVITPGPQGPAGVQGEAGSNRLDALEDVAVANRVNQSVLFYDAASGKWIGNDANTIVSLTDGGNY